MLLHIFPPLFFAACVASALFARIARKIPAFERSGGIVVVALFVLVTHFEARIGSQTLLEWNQIRFVDVAALFFAWIGLLDDRRALSGAVKAFFQTLAVFAVAFFLFQPFVCPTELLFFSPIRGLFLLKIGSCVGLCFIATSLFVFVNSFRWLGETDGLASVLGIAYAGTLETIVLAWKEPSLNMQFAFLALIAILTGFLLINIPSTTIRLGNVGSLPISFLLAALSFCVFSYREYIRVVPLFCLWTLPTIDFVFGIARRWTQGKNVFSTDKEGLRYSIRRRLGKDWRASLAILALQIPLSVAVVVSFKTGYDLVSLVAAALYWAGLPASGLICSMKKN
ncbi:MAG: hypothetical protein J6X44_02200 [Thermoguttaceae bacterium]|nr:hypothetical protein [Thermoguttaceae bacterium]